MWKYTPKHISNREAWFLLEFYVCCSINLSLGFCSIWCCSTGRHVCFRRNGMATTLKWNGKRKRLGTLHPCPRFQRCQKSKKPRSRKSVNHLTIPEPKNSLLLWSRRRKPPSLPQTMFSSLICTCAHVHQRLIAFHTLSLHSARCRCFGTVLLT